MRRALAVGTALLIAIGLADARGDSRRGAVLADRLFVVADDFVVEAYHNGLKVPEAKRALLADRFGATAERIDLEFREGDWVVFNVVNNRLRWGGCSYFAVAGRGDSGLAFTSDPSSGRWSCCDDPAQVGRFVNDRDFLADNPAQSIANPWREGDGLMNEVADGWGGKPLWGKSRNTWIKFVAK